MICGLWQLAELEPRLQGKDNEWVLLYYRCKLEPEQGKALAEAYGQDSEDEEYRDVEEIGGKGSESTVGIAAALALRDNCDMLTAAAEYAYAHDHFRRCYQLSCRYVVRAEGVARP